MARAVGYLRRREVRILEHRAVGIHSWPSLVWIARPVAAVGDGRHVCLRQIFGRTTAIAYSAAARNQLKAFDVRRAEINVDFARRRHEILLRGMHLSGRLEIDSVIHGVLFNVR